MSIYSESFISFSKKEMSIRPLAIRMWANQNQDRELADLAKQVIEAAGEARR